MPNLQTFKEKSTIYILRRIKCETDEERIEEYTLPVEFFDELTKDERDSLYCWLNKDTIAQA
jgi:superfamily II DNA helicase RecQ